MTTPIDDYIAESRPDLRPVLERVRATIRAAAPDASEVISYRMPAFRGHGILVYFAGFTSHIGLYPPVSGDADLERDIARYAGPKGNLRLPLEKPIPFELIEGIVRLRAQQDRERVSRAGGKRGGTAAAAKDGGAAQEEHGR